MFYFDERAVHIIIPAYNAGKHIRKCLDSCLSQIYKFVDIICVDDGSTDDTWEILMSYKNSCPYFNCIHQNNEGVSAARNKGVEIVPNCGYIAFVDSDDTISPNYISRFMNVINKNQYNLVMDVYDNHLLSCSSIVELLLSQPQKKSSLGVYNKIIITNIVKSLSFCTELSFGEDYLYNVVLFTKVSSFFLMLDKGDYHYNNNPESVTHLLHNNKKTAFFLLDSTIAWFRCYKVLEELSFYNSKELKQCYVNRVSISYLRLMGYSKRGFGDFEKQKYKELSSSIKKESIISIYNPDNKYQSFKKWLFLFFPIPIYALRIYHFFKS